MTKKVIILFILLGITLLVMIVLHVLSAFYSFTLFGLEEEQYKVLVSDAILVLAIVFVLAPLFQVSKKARKLRQVSKNTRKLRQEVANVPILGNRCYRCGHEWRPKNMDVGSRICPNCKSPYWYMPRRKK